MAMDSLDRKIVFSLIGDARKPLSQVATDLGVATATVHQRFHRLQERGVVQGARLVLDWEQVGLPIVATISLTAVEAGPLQRQAERLAAIPEVQTCFAVTGEFDLMVVVRARSSQHLGEVLDQIRSVVGGPSRTVVVLSVFFEGRPVPLPEGI